MGDISNNLLNIRLLNIENNLNNVHMTLNKINVNLLHLNKKVDEKNNVDNDVLQECKKMGNHIDFIENVYENVKHPLGFICNKIKYISGNNNQSLTNKIPDNNLKITNCLPLD